MEDEITADFLYNWFSTRSHALRTSFVDVLMKNNKKEMVDVIVKTLDIVDRAKDTHAWTESFVNTLRQLYKGLRDTLGGEKKAATTLVIESPEKQWVTVVMKHVHDALGHADVNDAAAFRTAVDAVVKAIDGMDFDQLTQPLPSSSASSSASSSTAASPPPAVPLRRRVVGDTSVTVAAWLGLAAFLRTAAGEPTTATTAPVPAHARAALLSVCLGRYLPHHVARPWLATADAGGTDVDPTRGRKRKMHGGALTALQQQP